MIKRFLKRSALSLAVVFTVLSAMPAVPAITQIPTEVEAAIEPRADQIYWMYRKLSDGTVQKRRWNATKGYWVDPHWIDVN